MPQIKVVDIRALTPNVTHRYRWHRQQVTQGQLIETTLTLAIDGGHTISYSNPVGVNGTVIPISDSCKTDMQLCHIVSDISTLLNGPNSPWPDTEKLYPSAVAAAQVREGFTDVKYEVRHDTTTDKVNSVVKPGQVDQTWSKNYE